MRALVTGAAGFIGSHLVDTLLAQGWTVRGVDCFTDYYDPAQKRHNLTQALSVPAFSLVQADLATAALDELLEGVDVVFHEAGQPGVRRSWGEGFGAYVHHNVLATQRLLEAARQASCRKFVYASSSSVYGNAPRFPTTEEDLPMPESPYGVTKLAAEHLCTLYGVNWSLPTISLRYFTVYGPRQRPDMAMSRLIGAALEGAPFPIFGDGSAVRDFTYVRDVVRANIAAASADCPPGSVTNISGGASARLSDVIAAVEEISGLPITLVRHPDQRGDARITGGSLVRAKQLLGWEPQTGLHEGLSDHVAWYREDRGAREVA